MIQPVRQPREQVARPRRRRIPPKPATRIETPAATPHPPGYHRSEVCRVARHGCTIRRVVEMLIFTRQLYTEETRDARACSIFSSEVF